MSEIILWSLLAFFGAFGLVEFIRFVYTDWNNSQDDFHLVVRSDKSSENTESILRNAILATDCKSIILLTEDTGIIIDKLQERYPYVEIMNTEEYINYLKKQGM